MSKDLTILMVEDDDGHASLIRKSLRRYGLDNEILHFRDGQEVIDFLFWGQETRWKKEQSFVCLLDINLPKLSGVEVLARIKGDQQLCPIPVIMLTTTDDPEEVMRCYRIGCNGYIIKPVECGELTQIIKDLARFLEIMQIPLVSRQIPNIDDQFLDPAPVECL